MTFRALPVALTFVRARAGEPKVQPFHFPKTVLRGEKVRVVCSAASGATPLSFQWLRDGLRLADGAHHVSIKTFEDFSVLEVSNIGVAHNGNYTCALKNLQGSDSYSSQLLVQGVVHVEMRCSGALTNVADVYGVYGCEQK
ncbi:hypothetical protein V5799_002961 [Amblyomma americanum]|uniref:Ig-like domain-containing protein n=1 Tax=Amblyomma americanum TaxID=6943 RepID=A0AAQ4DAB7_AMBAM